MITIHPYGLKGGSGYSDLFASELPPDFTRHREDVQKLILQTDPFQKYSKIIVIGDGGSYNTFAFYARALKGNGKKVFLLNSVEIDLINNLKNEYTKVDTVVVCICPYGEQRTIIEAVLLLSEYPVIVITHNDTSALGRIAVHFGWTVILHSQLIDRFSSFNAPSFVPALLFGLPVDRIQKGAHDMYALCATDTRPSLNPAWIIAQSLYGGELIGKDELFVSLRSYYLETALPLLMQLVHETTGKQGKGWSVIGETGTGMHDFAHQKLYAGKKNVVGIFVTIHNQRDKQTVVSIPKELHGIKLNNGTLAELDNKFYDGSMNREYEIIKNIALTQNIPIIHIELERLDSYHCAQLIALWQMVAYYMARLITVDPFS